MSPEEELKYYQKAYKREKTARKEAELILEAKAAELYQVNKRLLYVNANLEQKVHERTEEIKEAEEQYRQLVQTANDVIFRTDLQGNFTFLNQTGIRLSEYNAEYLIGKSFTVLVDKAYHAEITQHYTKQLIEEVESTYFEYKTLTKSGKEIWLGQNVQLILKNGFPDGFLAVARNITERVKSDKKLRRSEEKYKKMFEGAFDGVMRLGDQGQFLEWNSKMESMLEYSANELTKMTIEQIIHPDDIEISKIYASQLIETGFYTNYTGRIINKHGKIITIEVNSSATYDANGIFSGSIDNIRDISERISIEKAIIRSEEKYRGIIENLELGLLEVNLDDRITKVYPSFCDLSGYSETDLIGKNPTEFLLHPDSIAVMRNEYSKRSKGESSVYEVQIRKKSGEYKWVIISGAPFYDETGKPAGSIGVHLDISKQKQLQKELKQANKIAEASSKAKELFLANMSHEIRTPLNAVIGLSNLLKQTQLDADQVSYVTNINSSAQSLLLLVNDILDITKIESGKLELNVNPFNLKKTMTTIMASTSYLAEEKNLELQLKMDEALHPLYLGDELKLSQILINLVNNAIKFTSAGSVFIKIKPDNKPEHIKIAVSDTGKGIAEEAIANIFEDFSQEDNTISKEYGGTGLGLSISKNLVALMGGDLQVKSTINKGTTFYFTIKMAPDTTDSELHATAEHQDQLNWGEVNILTVEDNLINQFVIKATIKNWKGETDIANNGQEAIDMICKKEYDIILMDLQMPIMDGITATKIIRQELNSEIPIIAFTANALKQEKQRCIAIGMNDYVSKPFQESDLKTKITQLVNPSLKKRRNEAPIINDQEGEPIFTVEKLIEIGHGDQSFVNKLVQIFVEEGEEQLTTFRTDKDPDTIGRLAHKIKPSIDYISNSTIKQAVREIEKRAFIGDPQILTSFIKHFDALITSAKRFLAEN